MEKEEEKASKTTTSFQNKRNGQLFGLHTNFALAGIQIEFGFCRGDGRRKRSGRRRSRGRGRTGRKPKQAHKKESGGVMKSLSGATFLSC